MADTDKTEGFLDKHLPFIKKVAVAIGIFLALPQDLIVRRGLPSAWAALRELAGLGADLGTEALRRARNWLDTQWTAFRNFVITWFLFSVGVMVTGILLANHGYPFGGQVVAVIGALLLQSFFLFLMIVGSAFAKVLVLKIGAFASDIAHKIIGSEKLTDEERKLIVARHEKYKSDLLAALVLISAALVPFELFVSWKVLGVTVILTGLAMPAIFAVIHQKGEFGVAIRTIKIVSIVLTLLTLLAFLAVELMPQSFGAMRFSKADNWFARINKTEWIVGLVALGLLALLLKAAFTKDKDSKLAYLTAFKWLAPISAVVVAFLIYRGTADYKELTGHEAPDVGSGIDKVKHAIGSIGSGGKKEDGARAVAIGAGSGTYLPPPDGTSSPSTAPSSSTRRPVVQTRPMPPRPAPEKVETLGEGLDKLDNL